MVSPILEWTNKQNIANNKEVHLPWFRITVCSIFCSTSKQTPCSHPRELAFSTSSSAQVPTAAALARSPVHPTWYCPISLLAQQQCRQMTLPPPHNALPPGLLLALWLLRLSLLFWILFSLVWKHWGTLDSGPNIGLTLFSVHVISLQGLILSCGPKAFLMSDFFYSANYFWNSSVELHVLIGVFFSFLLLVFIYLSTYWWTFGLCSVWGYYK